MPQEKVNIIQSSLWNDCWMTSNNTNNAIVCDCKCSFTINSKQWMEKTGFVEENSCSYRNATSAKSVIQKSGLKATASNFLIVRVVESAAMHKCFRVINCLV